MAESQYGSGFNIIKQNGCPSWDGYDDSAGVGGEVSDYPKKQE